MYHLGRHNRTKRARQPQTTQPRANARSPAANRLTRICSAGGDVLFFCLCSSYHATNGGRRRSRVHFTTHHRQPDPTASQKNGPKILVGDHIPSIQFLFAFSSAPASLISKNTSGINKKNTPHTHNHRNTEKSIQCRKSKKMLFVAPQSIPQKKRKTTPRDVRK
jgi:hypothetical protein